VHVTLDLRKDLPSLRKPKCIKVIWKALADSAHRKHFRINQFSVQDHHIHLLGEAKHKQALSRGIQGLKIRIARRLNRCLGRTGAVFADRYHARILKTPREVFRALRYVLLNSAKHLSARGRHFGREMTDLCCTAAWFDGWKAGWIPRAKFKHGPGPPPVAPARTWLLNKGWRRFGLLEPPHGLLHGLPALDPGPLRRQRLSARPG
jgi:REP element-mobilizing transposase RayT